MKGGAGHPAPPSLLLSAPSFPGGQGEIRGFRQHMRQSVHNFVVFYFHFRYCLFKTQKYFNSGKVAEAVSRLLSTP